MKNIFIWLAKFALAIVTMVVIVFIFAGFDYLVTLIADYFINTNKIEVWNLNEKFETCFFIFSVITTIYFFMSNIEIGDKKC